MIVYDRLFALMKEQGKSTTHIRNEKIIGQETLRKLKKGTGVKEEYDYVKPTPTKTNDDEKEKNEKIEKEKEKKWRETSVDTKSIESLCVWLNCQPSDIMEVIPNTWENADRLCDILKCKREELTDLLDMQGN